MTADTRLIADRYRLEQQIGAGAMGVVWRAHDVRLDRTVAVKQLLVQPGLSEVETAAAKARAMREGRIAARLQHPHAICVYDVALDDVDSSGTEERAAPWLIMEYLPSRSLAAVLADQGTLPPPEVARIGRQVAAALAVAHRAGIVHRDVKPGNVLLGVEGIVKITDFGISRASWEAAVTATGVVAGTPAYFAPEVARGEAHNPPTDVFSLGSTLYAAVEGEPPFGLDDNTLALLRAVADGQIRPPQQAGPLSALLMQMLRADPAQRPSMSEAVVALDAAVHGRAPARSRGCAAVSLPSPPTAVDLPASTAPPTTPITSATRQATRRDSPAPPEAKPTSAQHRSAQHRARQWRTVLLGTAGCLLILLGIIAVATQGTREGSAANVLPVPSAAPGATPAATTAPTPVPAPGPVELEQTVRTYYGLLPEDTRVAWEFLGAPERAKPGGFGGYVNFWNGIDRVRVRTLTVQGNTVLVNLQFEPKDRGRTLERYQLTMSTTTDGRVLIESSDLIGSVGDGNRGGRGDQAGERGRDRDDGDS